MEYLQHVRISIMAMVGFLALSPLLANAQFIDERKPVPAKATSPATVEVVAPVALAGSAAVAVMSPDDEVWELHPGRPIHVQLQEWATKAGWNLYWRHDKAWYPPANALFKGPFDKALEEVVRSLFAEGKSVHLRLWDGNRVAEVVRSTPK